MEQLRELSNFFNSTSKKEIMHIPKIWNKYVSAEYEEEENNVLAVDKYNFYHKLLSRIIDKKQPQSAKVGESVIYCGMPRYSTAFDIDQDGDISSGTFLRMMVLLPLLEEMKVNVLYLLPITEYSMRNLKGDMGSPFAIMDFFRLDPNLHDPILDPLEGFGIQDEFKALIQACHNLGIKVVIDFIPRVTARNSYIIAQHPEWVYWIKKDQEVGFAPPEIPGLPFFEECTEKNIHEVYQADSTRRHLEKFAFPPNVLNPQLWEEVKALAITEKQDILELIEEYFGITTPPAHSDWINDVQPVWTDITFWKLYFDVSPMVSKMLPKNQAPYVMFDTIKANKFPCSQPNFGLWELFKDAIKFYLEEYDLDGFRFDIGHTLPPELLRSLFDTVLSYKKDAIFISEDLFNRNHANASKTGYNIMLGSCWKVVSDITKASYNDFVKELLDIQIYVYACAETHDTPRIVSRKGGVRLARALGLFNSFLPNGIPFILTGYEVNEKQPINCGLADNTHGENIPRAFFNKMQIDWASYNAEAMIQYLNEIMAFRKDKLELLRQNTCEVLENESDIVVYAYNDRQLAFLFNTNPDEKATVDLDKLGLDWKKYCVRLDSRFGRVDDELRDALLTLDRCGSICIEKKEG